MLNPPDAPPDPGARPDGGGLSLRFGAMVLLAISAAVVFWAGLSLGAQTVGRNEAERKAIEAFAETYQSISDEYVGDSDPGELLQGAIQGMFDTLEDPYSAYMGSDEFGSRFEDISGEFGGIGAVMNTEEADGDACILVGGGCSLRVVEVLEEAPALQAGLLADDRVLAVDGSSLDGLTIAESVLLIRGPRGSDVTLTVDREGVKRELVITRELILTKDVRSAVIGEGRVGYLRVDSFSANAAEDFRTALGEVLGDGVQHVIVDVRDDPGGFVDAAVAIASQFLEEGAVFWEEDAARRQVSVDVSGGGLATDPGVGVVVLVNEGTASASEILAGALQDAGRARLVGRPTFGKGTVQEWTQLPGENGGFRLSVAKWLTRNKTWIDGEGLMPDVDVAASRTRYDVADETSDPTADRQLDRALSLLLDEPLGPAPTPQASSSPAPSPEVPLGPATSAAPR